LTKREELDLLRLGRTVVDGRVELVDWSGRRRRRRGGGGGGRKFLAELSFLVGSVGAMLDAVTNLCWVDAT
jgi:hypothetical protein